MPRPFVIDPNKVFYIFDTRGEWHGIKLGDYLYDTRGDYIGFTRGETYDVYTTSGEWIGNLYPDGRIVRKRNYKRPPLLPKDQMPPKPPKPSKMPASSPLPPLPADLGFDKIDVMEWDDEVFKRLSDLIPDKGEENQ